MGYQKAAEVTSGLINIDNKMIQKQLLIIMIIIIIINLFIVDNKNTIKNIFLSTNVALKTWLI